jgi:hypothetical protein
MSFDYASYASQISNMSGGSYNKTRFGQGTYLFEITRSVLKQNRNGAPMIVIEGEVKEVTRSTDESNEVGEIVSFVNVQNRFPHYFMRDQLAITAAVLGVPQAALKADTNQMVEALQAVFPEEGGEDSVAVGRTIRVNHTSYTKDDGSVKTATYFDPAR